MASHKTLLMLFSDTGGGHRSSACAVAQALHNRYGDRVSVRLLDPLDHYAPWPFNRIDTLYPYMVRLGGVPWAVGYRLSDRPSWVRAVTEACWPRVRRPVLSLVQDHPADAIVSCHPILNQVLARGLHQSRIRTRLIALVTDLATAHAFWFTPHAQLYLVPTEEVRRRAVASGIPPERVLVTGLPVGPQFVAAAQEDRLAVRQRLGLDTGRPVVLVVGGGEGMGPLHALCHALTNSGLQFSIVVITGRNERLRARLAGEDWPVPVRVEGFVQNMHEWMRAADILVSKAGPSTICEALVMGLPIILSGALPGQEVPNVDYVVRGGAGIWAPTPGDVVKAVRELLSPARDKLEHMAARARALARPDAAQRIAEILWEFTRER
jgi:1,2-diacylglycerol 3-beta-galactosyltransferase